MFRPIESDSHTSFYREKKRKKSRWGGSISKKRRSRIYARDNNECAYCGSSENLTIDHKVPKSKGGSNNDDNLQTCCKECNQLKADTHPFHI